MHARTTTQQASLAGKERPEALDRGSLEADLRAAVAGEVRFDEGDCALYAADASNYRQLPIGVVIPRSPGDAAAAVQACREHGAPLLSRGGGTSLCGQCCNEAVILDFSKYANQLLWFDPRKRQARVQPGLVLDHLQQATRPHNLVYGPDPATHGWCTFGGMIGNNSCGIHSVVAGRTVDNVVEMDVLTYDGLRLAVGETSEEELERVIAQGGRRGEIYRALRELRDTRADLIRQRYPKIPRRVSGYNLDALLPENGFNVAKALVGSEGTCVVVLEATVNLIYMPPVTSLLVLGYPDAYQAADHVTQVLEHGPVGLEGLDRKFIEFMRIKKLHPQNIELLPEGHGWLLVEFAGESKEETESKAHGLMQALRQAPSPPSMKLYNDPQVEQKIWEIRESGLGATAHVPGQLPAWPGWEDAAVPPERAGDYLRDFRKLLDKYDYDCSLYGHFGQGCIHCRITFDLETHDGVKRYTDFANEAADLVRHYGGTPSGEHGDGQSKADFLEKIYGKELLKAFETFKSIWDPEWKMNPGKVLRPCHPDQNLRLGQDYAPWEPQTYFAYPGDAGSLASATTRCVGVGKCRRHEDAFMCPSYLATHEEKHATRGRAHLLFEMLTGGISGGWKNEAVREALDLCLSCKGCKIECPVNVDMATYKSEFLAQYYKGRIRPRDAYAMGLIDWWARLAALAPALANYFGQKAPFAALAKKLAGVHRDRRLPAFARETFTHWHRREGRRNPYGPPVVLYPDLFNNHFYPQTLKAAMRVLEHYGYDVIVPRRHLPEVRPMIHYGMLPRAIAGLRRNIAILRPYVREGLPVIGLEPSTVAVFRDEMPNLLPNDEDAWRLTHKSKLLEEFLVEEEVAFPRLAGQALLHCHCHDKAALKVEASRKALGAMGLELSEPENGCCGMAGSFGFEEPHHDISMQIGGMRLLPAIEALDKSAFVVADGFSCRTQVAQGSDRHPLHFAEILLMAIEQGPRGPAAAYPEDGCLSARAPVLSHKAAGLAAAALIGGIVAGRMLWRGRK